MAPILASVSGLIIADGAVNALRKQKWAECILNVVRSQELAGGALNTMRRQDPAEGGVNAGAFNHLSPIFPTPVAFHPCRPVLRRPILLWAS